MKYILCFFLLLMGYPNLLALATNGVNSATEFRKNVYYIRVEDIDFSPRHVAGKINGKNLPTKSSIPLASKIGLKQNTVGYGDLTDPDPGAAKDTIGIQIDLMDTYSWLRQSQ